MRYSECKVWIMSLLGYISWMSNLPFFGSGFLLLPEALHKVNKSVMSLSTETDEAGPAPKHAKKIYYGYFSEDHVGQ